MIKQGITRQLKELLSQLKSDSLHSYLQNITSTMDTHYALWKATKRLKQPKQHIPPIRKINGTWAKTDREKAEAFANHLQTVFQPLNMAPNNNYNKRINAFLKERMPNHKLKIPHVTLKEVKKTITHNLSPNKAPGYDLITGYVIKQLPEKGILMLTQLFNAVLRLSYFPVQWKVSEVILIPKDGKPLNEPTSYRPISLLPVMSKILEKILLKRLMDIIEEKGLIPDHQFGFRRQHSTIEQVHRVVNAINKTFEGKSYCAALFLDISQAFDKVWHTGLLYKLKQHFPYHLYALMKSYLHERYFRVRYEAEVTSLHKIESGVPQGSVLGPVLYLLFTADLPTCQGTITTTFADDTAVLSISKDPLEATRLLQQNVNMIEKWTKKWQISLNETKSHYILFTKCKHNAKPITVKGKELQATDCVKYLGMHLDKGLTWKRHINIKRKQLDIQFRKYYWLVGRRSSLSIQNKLLLYKTIFKPVWSYGIQLWGTTSNSNISKIERFQSKSIRIMINAPWYIRNDDIYRDLKMETVKDVIRIYSETYAQRLRSHPNPLATGLINDNLQQTRRLKRKIPLHIM